MTKRLRLFAGPNGSGKSTIKEEIEKKGYLRESYINPDEIEKHFIKYSKFDLSKFKIHPSEETIQTFFRESQLLKNNGKTNEADNFKLDKDNFVNYKGKDFDSYLASVFSDLIRKQILAIGGSFAFETVMSSLDKIDILKLAKENGYKTYLYFVTTRDVKINIERIKSRVYLGGHNVPECKTKSRYLKSLENLSEAIPYCDRVYLFDNSNENSELIAEINQSNGQHEITLKGKKKIPHWFKIYVIDKI